MKFLWHTQKVVVVVMRAFVQVLCQALLLWIFKWGITSWGSTIIFPMSQMTLSKLPKITQLVTDPRQPLNLGNLAQEPVLFNQVEENDSSIKACQNVNECSNSPASLAGYILITIYFYLLHSTGWLSHLYKTFSLGKQQILSYFTGVGGGFIFLLGFFNSF